MQVQAQVVWNVQDSLCNQTTKQHPKDCQVEWQQQGMNHPTHASKQEKGKEEKQLEQEKLPRQQVIVITITFLRNFSSNREHQHQDTT